MLLKSFAQFMLRERLMHLIVHVTNHCNFRCQHCFIDFSPKRDLKLHQYRALGQQVGELFWLDIGGGEPFLRKDLSDIVGCFRAKVVQIPTNASIEDLILEQVKRLKRNASSELTISMSLDGLKETHEKIRGQPGNWNQVWNTFDKLRRLGGVSIKINTVLSNANCHEIIDLMKVVRQRGPDFHSIILLRGDPINPDFALPVMTELRAMGPQIFEILRTYDYGRSPLIAHLLRNYHRYMWNVSLQTLEERRQVVPCLAGRAHMVVMGDGSVSSCEMLKPVGNIKDLPFEAICGSAEFKQQVQDIRDGKCFCTHNCAMFDSIMFSKESLPHLLYEEVTT